MYHCVNLVFQKVQIMCFYRYILTSTTKSENLFKKTSNLFIYFPLKFSCNTIFGGLVKELFEHFVSDGKLLQLQSNHVSRRYSHCVFRFIYRQTFVANIMAKNILKFFRFFSIFEINRKRAHSEYLLASIFLSAILSESL